MPVEILELVGTSLNPWGTEPGDAAVDDVTWCTSMFPRRDRGRYHDLPLKLRIMNRLGFVDDHPVSVRIAIRMLG